MNTHIGSWMDRGRSMRLIIYMAVAGDFVMIPAMGVWMWVSLGSQMVGLLMIAIGPIGGAATLFLFGRMLRAVRGWHVLQVQGIHPESAKRVLALSIARFPGEKEEQRDVVIARHPPIRHEIQFRLSGGLVAGLSTEQFGARTASYSVGLVDDKKREAAEKLMTIIREELVRGISPPPPPAGPKTG